METEKFPSYSGKREKLYVLLIYFIVDKLLKYSAKTPDFGFCRAMDPTAPEPSKRLARAGVPW
jgi:hypothetical protein